MTSYVEARDVATAVAAMVAGARPVAGGTDLVVGSRQGRKPLPHVLVGIHRIAELNTITEPNAGTVRIGALVTHQQILESPLLAHRTPALLDASAIVGSHATRANGTIGGNVMNASPAMDTGAPLLCQGAQAVLAGPGGERRVGLDELWEGPGRTTAAPEELLIALELPAPPTAGSDGAESSAYVRLQYRRQMEIAVVGAAARLTVSPQAQIVGAAVAITALAPVIHRVDAAERALSGAPASGDGLAEAVRIAGQAVAEAARPISDVRGSADYRRAMGAVMARRAVTAALARARGEQVRIPASDWSVWR